MLLSLLNEHFLFSVCQFHDNYVYISIDVPLSLSAMKFLKWKDDWGRVQTFRLIDEVSSKWRDFGSIIGLQNNLLVAWEEQFLRNSARCWCEVMTQWVIGGQRCEYPVSWVGLYTMLDDVSCHEVSKRLQKAVASAETVTHPCNVMPSIFDKFTSYYFISFVLFLAICIFFVSALVL